MPVLPKDESMTNNEMVLPAGNYMDVCTELSVRIQIKCPYYSSDIPKVIKTASYAVIIVISNRESEYLTQMKGQDQSISLSTSFFF